MTRVFSALFIALSLSLSTLSYAQDPGTLFDSIHVVVNPSGKALDPMAVFLPCEKGLKTTCGRINTILTHDMKISGVFKVLDPKSFIANAASESLETTNWTAWVSIGARYIIKGRVTGTSKKTSLDLRLYNVVSKATIPIKWHHDKVMGPKGLYKAVSSFANGVILAITGSRGLFDSRIYYSVKLAGFERIIGGVNMDGTHRRVLVSNKSSNMFPAIGPGGKLLYTSFLPGVPSLYLGRHHLTRDTYQYRSAVYCAGAGLIAASVDMGKGQSDIVLLDPKTGRIKKNLTNSAADEVSPSWSPDCKKIAYVSNRTGTLQIYVVGANGRGRKRLTMLGTYNTSPAFGKDGIILFSGMDEFVYDIFSVDMDGHITRLTQQQGSNKDPAWSPDYRYAVFVSNRQIGWNLYGSTPDGRYQFRITKDGSRYATPVWAK